MSYPSPTRIFSNHDRTLNAAYSASHRKEQKELFTLYYGVTREFYLGSGQLHALVLAGVSLQEILHLSSHTHTTKAFLSFCLLPSLGSV